MTHSLLPLKRDEVLAHLQHILGDDVDITEDQLRKFMHQLKKLILEDEMKGKENKENISFQQERSRCSCHDKCSIELGVDQGDESDESSESENSYRIKTDECVHKVPKPVSSFIKPWNLNYQTGSSRRSLKSDPVSLYQQYKKLWRKHRVPGEDGHPTVRWRVREKMLGQDPQPRPVSSCSTTRARMQ